MAEPLRAGLPEEGILRRLDAIIESTAPGGIDARFYAALRAMIRELGARQVWRETTGAVTLDAIRQLPPALLREAAQRGWQAMVDSLPPSMIPSLLPWEAFEKTLASAFTPGSPLAAAIDAGHALGSALLPRSVLSAAKILPRGSSFLERYGADRVRQITAATKAGMRDLLMQGFTSTGIPQVERVARLKEVLRTMQPSGVIGLNQPQASALAKHIQRLVDDPDLSAKQIQYRINQRFEKLLRERADMIDKTENAAAGNEAVLETFEEANATGRLRIDGLGGQFRSEYQVSGASRTQLARRPPLHPRCKCGMRTVFLRIDGGVRVYGVEWVARGNACTRCASMDKELLGQVTA